MRSTSQWLTLSAWLLVSACASIERFQGFMDGQLGKSSAELQTLLGYNYIERPLADGRKAYTWVWTTRSVTPGYSTPARIYSRSRLGDDVFVEPGFYIPPRYYEDSCEFTFILSPQDRVVDWQARGEGCRVYPGPGLIYGPGTGADPTQGPVAN